jgi:hypothetical protein
MTIPAELAAAIEAFSTARAELQKFEDAATEILSWIALVPEFKQAKGTVLVAKQALHTARLAAMEAVDQARDAVRGMVEPRAVGGGGRIR